MQKLSDEKLHEIATARGIDYVTLEDADPLVVRTRMSRSFPVRQEVVFEAFADPMAHVPLFEIIKSSTPPIRSGVEKLLGEDRFFAFEHVEEGGLPPRLMLVRYTLERPVRIIKEAVTDPFEISDIEALDRKKGRIVMEFSKIAEAETVVSVESSFQTTTGAIFARGFVDHVWLNFYEKMMLANGMIKDEEFLTGHD